MALFKNAKWIRSPKTEEICPKFVKTFEVGKGLSEAKALIGARGVYFVTVNGIEFSDKRLAPGWTSFRRALADEEDLTPYLHEGKNEIAFTLGSGWATGEIIRRHTEGWMAHGQKDPFGRSLSKMYPETVALVAEISLSYENGEKCVIGTDGSFDVLSSQYRYADFYNGETFDGTAKEVSLGHAEVIDGWMPKCEKRNSPCVAEHERVGVREIIRTPKGETVLDFGQNLAGYPVIRYTGKAGERIRLSFGEVLDKDGNFYNDNYRRAKNDVLFITDGKTEVYRPHLTFQGFRYLRLDEFPGEVNPDDFTAVALYSDMKRIGRFESGNGKINKLYENILWGQRSNFIDVPTDCPQRDERLGWTGDAEVFCRTACLNYNTKGFFAKWLKDMALDQCPNGAVGSIIPATFIGNCSAAWGDAATVCPFEIYLAYGDKKLLRENFPMMKKWVDYIHGFGEEEYLWIGGSHYGDWVAMDAGYGSYIGATQTDLIASAYFYRSTDLLVRAGKILGIDVSEYEAMKEKIRTEFRRAFMKDGMPVVYPKGDALKDDRKEVVRGVTQTAIVLILHFGLAEEGEKKNLADTLVSLIEANGGRMTTGFVGTPYILHALTENGRSDVAYDLLLQEKNPSWLFSVNHGATTMWEHWDSVNENGEFWSTDMNSFNHYAYGAVYDWIFGKALGAQIPDEGAGYREVAIAPHPDRRLGFMSASEETAFGKFALAWAYRENEIEYHFEIPEGMTAALTLPGESERTLTAGNYKFVRRA